MDLSNIPAGRAPPWDITVVVEIPIRADETEAGAGTLYQPGNFGFVPKTLMPDGEPCQALVVGSVSVRAGALLRSRPIGLLVLDCDGSEQPRLLAGPRERLHPFYADTTSYRSLPSRLLEQVEDFFAMVRDVPEGGAIRVVRWGEAEEAAQLIRDAMDRHRLSLPESPQGRCERAG